MLVPETPMYEKDDPASRENNIRLAWETWRMQAVSKAEPV
jgi:hypothetical protein